MTELLRHLNVSLVHGHLFDVAAAALHDGHDPPRFLPIHIHARRNKNSIRTQPARRYARHRGTHAELARFITRGTNDTAPLWRTSDDYRLSLQRWIIALFNRSVKSVHI